MVKLYKEMTLKDKTIQKKVSSFVPVMILREDAPKYGLPNILGVPTVFVMTGDKKTIEQGVGYLEEDDLGAVIDRFNKKVGKK